MSFQQPRNVQAVIRVIGVGGGGSNAIDRMIEDGVQDVTFVAINTDAQVLRNSKADYRICIGERLTRGMGAGGDPTVGEKAAEETNDELYEILKGTDMVFITAGMGGGTGTGAAPIVASIAQDLGILTVAVVTKPFKFEGNKRLQQAERGLEQLRKYVDALVVVPNDRLVEAYAKRGISILQGFQIVDGVLRQGIQGVADLITKTGVVNVDFADVKTILANSGEALMSIGTGAGENRIQQAIEAAMSSPLLDVEIRGAKRILLNITSNENIKLTEISEAANTIEAIVDPDANIIWGSVIDPNFPADQVKITLVATGISNFRQKTQLPPRQVTREPEKRVAPEAPQPKSPS
ncbi:MAG: cell division protein FtsZ, partial [Chloroflexi bacterium]